MVNEVLLPQIKSIIDLQLGKIKVEIKEEVLEVIQDMKEPLKEEITNHLREQVPDSHEIVAVSTKIVQDVVIPEIEQRIVNKVNEAKEEVHGKLQSVVDEQVTKRFEEQDPDLESIVTASATIVNTIVVPQMEEKVTAKVHEVKELIEDNLKTKIDQGMSSGLDGLTQQMTSQVNEKSEDLKSELKIEFTEYISNQTSVVVTDVLAPQMEENVIAKVDEAKKEITEDLTSIVDAMKDPLKAELVETVESMKAPLKAELTSELTNVFDQRNDEKIQMMHKIKVSRDDCNSFEMLFNTFKFNIEYENSKDCYLEITFPREVSLQLAVSNFKVSKI